MSLIRRLFSLDILGTALAINLEQQEVIRIQQRLIERKDAELARSRLEHARNTRDLIENFWICQEGGIDVREPLLLGLQDLRDEVARLEEHAR